MWQVCAHVYYYLMLQCSLASHCYLFSCEDEVLLQGSHPSYMAVWKQEFGDHRDRGDTEFFYSGTSSLYTMQKWLIFQQVLSLKSIIHFKKSRCKCLCIQLEALYSNIKLQANIGQARYSKHADMLKHSFITNCTVKLM